jgi:hypothetical protein
MPTVQTTHVCSYAIVPLQKIVLQDAETAYPFSVPLYTSKPIFE